MVGPTRESTMGAMTDKVTACGRRRGTNGDRWCSARSAGGKGSVGQTQSSQSRATSYSLMDTTFPLQQVVDGGFHQHGSYSLQPKCKRTAGAGV